MQVTGFNWSQQIERWEKWWNRELERPLFQIQVAGPPAKPPRRPYRFLPMYDFSIPAEKIILDMAADLQENFRQARDAFFPGLWINFGPGVLSAMIGGAGECGENTIWFYHGKFTGREIADISLRLDRNSLWFRRLEEFFVAAARHLDGTINVGQTDIGGTLDVLSSLRPGEMLIFDLYDHPDEVKRLTWEIHAAWLEAFNYFNSLLPQTNHGYSAWAGLLSARTHYMLQCDFAYMISPEQFREFVFPELSAMCREIARPFYHLDGKGQLPHLEQLLSIPELAGIQWVPGAGAPDCSHWPDVYRQINDAGRLAQVLVSGDVAIIEKVLSQVKRPELLLFSGEIAPGQEERLEHIYRKYGIAPLDN